jgi:hypothetical protein
MTARAGNEGAFLEQRLAALRRRIWLVASFRGTAALVAVVLFTLVCVGLVDWRLHLPGLVRAFVLVALLAGSGLIVRRLLWQPLSEPTDDLSLALRVEERYPGLNDALASTVQFLGQATIPDGESASMRREAVRRALGRLGGLDFQRVVDTRGLLPAGLCSLAAVVPAVALTLLAPAVARTAALRLALPFAAIEWPRKTSLELDTVTKRIGRNRDYRLRGVVHGVIPKEVVVELSHEGFPPQRRTFAVKPDDNSFVMHLRPNEVHRNFRFRITANDAVTPEFSVEVLPLPVLVPLDGKPSPQLRLDLPRYTDLPSPQHLAPGTGNIDAIAGTVVTLRAAADRPLRRAWIEYQPELAQTPAALFLAPLGSTIPPGAVASLRLGRSVYQPVQATLAPDRRRFHVTFRPAAHGSYILHFEDENDLANSRTFELRLRPDPAPVVRIERPSPSRDMLGTVLPSAELPLQVAVEDLQFAIRTVWLEYRTVRGQESGVRGQESGGTDEAPRQLLLYDHRLGLARDAAAWTGPGILAAPVPRLRPQRLEFDRTLPLRAIRHRDGTPLKEGDVVVLQACADDFDDVSVGKEPGRSPSVEVRIASRAEFDSRINQEQGTVQQELVRLHQKQRDALERVQKIEERMRKGRQMVPEQEAAQAEDAAQRARDEVAREEDRAERAGTEAEREKHRQRAAELRQRADRLTKEATELRKQAQQLAEAEELQQQINQRIGDDKEGLRAEVDRLRQTLRHNGQERSNAMDRMSAVARELDRLAEKELNQIEPKLASARKMEEMLDEKTRKERQAELEARARQADREAAAAEARAKKLAEQAEQASQAASKSDDQAEAARKQAEARRLGDEARKARQEAAEKRAAAERDRQDARRPADPQRPRQELAEARQRQQEVEKSLDALLQDLEPWSSTREVKNEAARLLQEQKEAQAQLEALQHKGLTGKSPEELTREEKADLEGLDDAQKRLADRAQKLLDRMERMAADRAEKDNQTARELLGAQQEARKGNLAGKMKAAQQSIQRNKLNEAKQQQGQALAELQKLVKNLEDRREAELDRLIRKLRQAEKQVEALMDEQERLQKKIREANKIPDKAKRDEELKKLARQQRALREKTREVLQQLSRLRNERARQALGQAGESMDEAAQQLGGGKGDDEKQEDALDRLDETRRELERERKRAEEELGREQLARVADTIKRLRDRQQGHSDEARRIQDAVQERKGWSRGLRASVRDLGQNQTGLAQETESVVKKDLTAVPVFARLLERSARAMRKAGDRFAGMVRQAPPPEALPDAEAARWQTEALRGLQRLLDAIKEQQGDDPRPLSQPGGAGGDDDGPQGSQGDDSLPPMAQLKLLRALQKEVNDRTKAFTEKHPDPSKLDAKARAELQEIQREQKEVADLLEHLTRPPGEEAMPDEDAKAEKEGEEK